MLMVLRTPNCTAKDNLRMELGVCLKLERHTNAPMSSGNAMSQLKKIRNGTRMSLGNVVITIIWESTKKATSGTHSPI